MTTKKSTDSKVQKIVDAYTTEAGNKSDIDYSFCTT